MLETLRQVPFFLNRHREAPLLEFLEPGARVDLATCRLRIGCSTTELPRPFIIKDLLPCQTYFRRTAIKLPSDCHNSLPKSGLRSPNSRPAFLSALGRTQ